jgi:hypothetical protein
MRVARFVAHIARPLAYRTEVPLPPRDGAPEQRSWDLTISDGQDAVGVEFEMVIHDAQAQTRRIHLKARDGGLSGLLVVIADTKGNRRALRDAAPYFDGLPRLRTSDVPRSLSVGKLPSTGMILF